MNMNKTIKNTFIALAAILGLTLTACTDKYEYQAATASGQQVYFDNVASKVSLSKDATTFNVQVLRIAADEAITIALTSTDESGIFTIPSSVSFAAGEKTATVTIGYNPDVLEYDDFKPITLTLADADNTTPYGDAQISFAAGIPSPFVTIGKAKFMDSFMFDDETYFDVVLQQNEINPDIYRLVNPYDEILVEGGYTAGYVNKGPSEYLTFQLRHAGEEVGGAILTRNNLVTFEPFRTGYYNSSYDSGDADGEVWGFHVSDEMFHASWHVEGAYLKNYVAAYQEDGTPGQINLAPWYYIPGAGGWNHSQDDKQIEILFPGFTPADYSAEIVYSGIFTDVAGSVFAVANLTLGADAETVKAVVVDGSADAAAVADAIAAGELEATDVAAGSIQVPIPEDMAGKLQVVVVVLDGENVKTVVAAKFEYYGGGNNPWQSLGIGYYTDDYIVSYYGEEDENGNFIPYEPETYQVEIEESTETPGIYRIKNAYAPLVVLFGETGGEKDITIHAEDPAGVYILNQETGVDFGKGEFSIESYGGYLIQKYSDYDPAVVIANFPTRFGTLQSGVITFPTVPTQDGTEFQGYLYRGGQLLYYGGTTLASKVVLPGAAPAEVAKAKRAAAASDFARRLRGNFHQSKQVEVKKEMMKKYLLHAMTLKK